jgi:hypothetical protein
MTFLGVLRSTVLCEGRRVFLGGLAILRHLHNDLDATLLGDADGQQLSNRSSQGVLATLRMRGWPARDVFQRHCESRMLFRTRRHADRFGNRLLVSLAILQPIPDMGDRQLITGPQAADFHAMSIDSNAVRAPEVSDEHFAILLRHTTMMPRHTQRIQSRIACRMAPHDNHGAIQRDIWTFIEGHQS